MKKIAVVTVNYNTQKETEALLDALKKVNDSTFKMDIIVVDNGSEKAFPPVNENVLLIRLETNTGFTGGYNTGIRKALERENDYILIVNSDTIIDKDLITNLVKAFDGKKNIGVTVPKIYFAKGHEFHKDRYTKEDLGKIIWYAGGYTDWENVKSVHRGVDEVDHGQYDTAEKVAFATGCCMMFKREVIETVGLFDEKYFLYYEDADLNERIQRAGYEIWYVPSAFLVHTNAASSGGAGNALQDYFITRNQLLFGMKYAPLRAKAALLRQSLRLLLNGRPNQKKAVKDFFAKRFGKGSMI